MYVWIYLYTHTCTQRWPLSQGAKWYTILEHVDCKLQRHKALYVYTSPHMYYIHLPIYICAYRYNQPKNAQVSYVMLTPGRGITIENIYVYTYYVIDAHEWQTCVHIQTYVSIYTKNNSLLAIQLQKVREMFKRKNAPRRLKLGKKHSTYVYVLCALRGL